MTRWHAVDSAQAGRPRGNRERSVPLMRAAAAGQVGITPHRREGEGEGRGGPPRRPPRGAKRAHTPGPRSTRRPGPGASSLHSLSPAPSRPLPPKRRGMCCDRCLQRTSVIAVLRARALAGPGSRPDSRLVPSAWGGLQPMVRPQPPGRPHAGVWKGIFKIRRHLSI